jgi:hypothetical protein
MKSLLEQRFIELTAEREGNEPFSKSFGNQYFEEA